MMLRRMLEGALKCALRDLLREEETSAGAMVNYHVLIDFWMSVNTH
jgi:hypothetical protein